MASLRNAPEPSAGSQTPQRSTSAAVAAPPCSLTRCSKASWTVTGGQRLGSVVGGAGLAVPGGPAGRRTSRGGSAHASSVWIPFSSLEP